MIDEAALNSLKEKLGYTETQWDTWKRNPRNLKVLENHDEIKKYRLITEITSSYGCAADHKVGDRIIFSGGGFLLCRENPEQICFGLLLAINPFAMMVLNRICMGEDPTQMAFNVLHCLDVGVDHGGWGEVVAEVRVEKVKE